MRKMLIVLGSGVASSKERPANRRKLMRSLSISSAIGSESPKHFWRKTIFSIIATGQCGLPPTVPVSLKRSAIDSASLSKGISRRQRSKNALAVGPPRSATVRSVKVGAALFRCIKGLGAMVHHF